MIIRIKKPRLSQLAEVDEATSRTRLSARVAGGREENEREQRNRR